MPILEMERIDVSTSSKEEYTDNDMQERDAGNTESNWQRSLNESRRILIKEMQESAIEDQEPPILPASSDELDGMIRPMRWERRLSTIIEESDPCGDSVRSNSARSNISRRRRQPSIEVPDIDINIPRQQRDVAEVREYLRHIFHLRYQHIPVARQDEYYSSTVVNRVRPIAAYLRWRTTRDARAALDLARSLGLNLTELDKLFRPRLEDMLSHINVDVKYVKARLLDSEHVWHWVHGYKSLAENAQWPKLAEQFIADKKQFDRIFPEAITYMSPESGIKESNQKALVRLGMLQLHGRYFKKIVSCDDYKLSKISKDIERMHREEQKILERNKKEAERRWEEWDRETSERYRPGCGSRSMETLAAKRGFSPDDPASKPSTRDRLKRWLSRIKEAMFSRK